VERRSPGPLKRPYTLTGLGAALLSAWAVSLRAAARRIDAFLQRYESLAERVEDIQKVEQQP